MNDLNKSWQDFCSNGDFLNFTRTWETGSEESFESSLSNGLKIRLYDIGILQIIPKSPSASYVLISSGVHGNETAPIEIVDKMVKDIWADKLEVKVNLMFIIGNPPAMNISKRFKIQNLNRLFSGRYQSIVNNDSKPDYECERARIIEQSVTDFFTVTLDQKTEKIINPIRYHFDLHTAIRPSKHEKFVVYPYLDERPWDKNHIAFFGGSDITTVLLGNQPAGTFSYYSSNRFNALSATVELGKVMPFGENDMNSFIGIDSNLRRLIRDEAPVIKPFNNTDYKVFEVKQDIIKTNDDFKLLLGDDVKNFTSFDKGTLLASDGNDESYTVEKDGEAIVFPNNNVPVGQRVGVLLQPVKL
ncbi:MAG: succinylglutamate desuccinylase [Kangiellaceae bacterium]|nr:succinylglutamate desuccinylase [Kangiellaceae bacterium]